MQNFHTDVPEGPRRYGVVVERRRVQVCKGIWLLSSFEKCKKIPKPDGCLVIKTGQI